MLTFLVHLLKNIKTVITTQSGGRGKTYYGSFSL